MFDSGASSYMTGNMTVLQVTAKIQPISIGLPSGTHTLACHHGTAVLGERLKLS